MIIIDDKYCIAADDKNYVLQEKSTVKNENSKNFGKETYKIIGYFGKLDSLFNYLLDLKIKTYVSSNRKNTIEQLLKKIDNIKKETEKQFKNIAISN